MNTRANVSRLRSDGASGHRTSRRSWLSGFFSGAARRISDPITAQSVLPGSFDSGTSDSPSRRCLSSRGVRGRMALSNPSTEKCGMIGSMANSSRCTRRGSSWKVGANATIRNDRIVLWGIGHPPQRLVPSCRSVCRREGT